MFKHVGSVAGLTLVLLVASGAAASPDDPEVLEARIDSLQAELELMQEAMADIERLIGDLQVRWSIATADSAPSEVTTDTLSFDSRLRSEPSPDSRVITTLPEGTALRIIRYAGDNYWEVATPTRAGYLHEVHFPGRPLLDRAKAAAEQLAQAEAEERARQSQRDAEESAARASERSRIAKDERRRAAAAERARQDELRASIHPQGSRLVTMQAYRALHTGMSYLEACAAIGFWGTELSRSSLTGYTTVMYMWQNPDGSNMNAMFQNGKLIQKSQFALP